MRKQDLVAAGCSQFESGTRVIYFLVQGEEVVYVGQTQDLENRHASHRSDDSKEFEETFYMRVDEKKARVLERALIRQYKPRLNRDSKYVGVAFFDKQILEQFGFDPPEGDEESRSRMLTDEAQPSDSEDGAGHEM